MSEKEKTAADTAEKTFDLELGKMLTDLRNGLQGAVESIDNFIAFLSKANLGEWDPSKIEWIQQPGTEFNKGPFEKAHFQESTEYKAMLEDLNKHHGKVNRSGVFYWLFQDGQTVGRKKLEAKSPQKEMQK